MSNQTVIITGASSGIGYALAEAFLAKGYNVVANARTDARLQAAAEKLNAGSRFVGVAGDIALPETAQQLFATAVQHFGRVDVLVNNAGVFIAKPISDYTPADVQQLIDTNLKGFVYPTQQAAAHMTAHKQGHIINITASVAIQPNQSVPASVAILIKGGIDHATKALALELAPHNIQVAAVAPGIIDTPMHQPESHGFLKALQPTGRLGSTQDVVDAVLYLSAAEFVTGITIPVDGGSSSGKW